MKKNSPIVSFKFQLKMFAKNKNYGVTWIDHLKLSLIPRRLISGRVRRLVLSIDY